jgi:hypothetical protein
MNAISLLIRTRTGGVVVVGCSHPARHGNHQLVSPIAKPTSALLKVRKFGFSGLMLRVALSTRKM